MRSTRALCCILILLASSSSGLANGFDKIFTKENRGRLCHKNSRGEFVVNRYELANLVMREVNVPLSLVQKANAKGDDKLQFSPENYRFAASSADPFGPRPYSAEETKVAEALREFRKDLAAYPRVQAKAAGYMLPDKLYGSVFYYDETVDILCDSVKETPEAKPKSRSPEQKIAESFRLRKTVDDLSADLKSAAAASVSFQEKNDVRTIAADAVAGVKITELPLPPGVFDSISVIPYVRYSASHSGKASDSELYEPGMLLTTLMTLPGAGFLIQAHGSRLFDVEHNAQKTDVDIAISPSFRIGDIGLFGGPLPGTGPARIMPNILFRATGNYIDDAGTNKEFKNKASYSSYGAVPELRLSFYQELLPQYLQLLSTLSGTFRYHMLENSNGVRDVRFMDFQLAYNFGETLNWQITVDLKRGDDPSTLDTLNLWRVGLGVKY